MSRRDDLLAEMGLAPVWRLRNSDPRQSGPGSIQELRTDAAGQEAQMPSSRSERIRRMDWPELKAAVAGCKACKLRAGCTQTVFGTGDEQADLLLVGEAPGAEEDRLGEPFVGQAGRLLDNMLAALGMTRGHDVYIANVLKCRPPGNRNPEPEEVAMCSPHLTRQIELIQPKLILAMGRFAVQTLLGTDASIASLRGQLHSYQRVPLVVTYHPAYLLRSLPDKSKAWADLVFARRALVA
ncbi:MAG: uracil-DNA glycosylase family protein [Burkholderiales bacterium]